MGTPSFAVPTLERLAEAGHDIAAVYSQPPRPAGRGRKLLPSPVQARAEALGIETRCPRTLRDAEEQARFADLRLEAAIVAAYGLILPEPILGAPRWGCINVHASLLPRWRGAAPIQRAIMAGDEETGISIMAMEKGLDTGPVFARSAIAIDRKTSGELTAELAQLGAAMMVETLERLPSLTPEAQPDEGITYASKVEKCEARLHFDVSAIEVDRRIRAFSPKPGAWFEHRGERIRILEAEIVDERGLPGMVLDTSLTIACSDGAVRPLRVQRAGRSEMNPDELLRGFAIPPGSRIGE